MLRTILFFLFLPTVISPCMLYYLRLPLLHHFSFLHHSQVWIHKKAFWKGCIYIQSIFYFSFLCQSHFLLLFLFSFSLLPPPLSLSLFFFKDLSPWLFLSSCCANFSSLLRFPFELTGHFIWSWQARGSKGCKIETCRLSRSLSPYRSFPLSPISLMWIRIFLWANRWRLLTTLLLLLSPSLLQC